MENFGIKIWNACESLMKLIVYKLLRLKLSESVWNNLMQFLKFCIVGLSNTLIGYFIYAITLKGLRTAKLWPLEDIYIAQLSMFLLSVAWSFYWNSKVVFKQGDGEHRNVFYALMKTYVSYAFTSLFLAEALLFLWVRICHINEYFAPILSLAITIPLNYLLQKYWAFGKRNGK